MNRPARSTRRQSGLWATFMVIGTVMLTAAGHAAATETAEAEGWTGQASAQDATFSARIEVFINRLSDEIQRDAERSILKSFEGRWPLESLQANRTLAIAQPDRSSEPAKTLVKNLPRSTAPEDEASPPAALADKDFLP
ncbi:hypothetical protein MK280_02370 [Myxococcota bacterium]|nr:hypothetical protein [Myxococcota bacterium]